MEMGEVAWARRSGLEPTPEDAEAVLGRLARMPPFSDARVALATLAQDQWLAPISNTDDEFLAGMLDELGPVFDTTVTAEQARAYKPNLDVFRFVVIEDLSALPNLVAVL